ncbi:hypothetical protein MTO96_049187 [Rhipicephalus appendiculatus]
MTREETVYSNHGTDRRQPLPSINQHGERKCYNCNIYGHIARDCPEPKRPLKCQRCQATDHTQRSYQAFSSNESNVATEALPCTGAGHVLIKEVIFNDDFTLVGLIDTGSSGCLLRASAAARCGIEMVQEPTTLYGFGSKNVPTTRSLGHSQAKISIDGVVAEKVPLLVVPDDAQSVDPLATLLCVSCGPLRCVHCLCFCCLQNLEVQAPPGTVIGRVRQHWSICYPAFGIYDPSGNMTLRILGPCCTSSMPCCCTVQFTVKSANGVEIGKIEKQWGGVVKEGFTDADTFFVTFPMDLDVNMKASLMAATMLVDYMFYETTCGQGSGAKAT